MMKDAEECQITMEFLGKGKSENGGYTRRQFECLGLGWPPPNGWRRMIMGRFIPKKSADTFLAINSTYRDQMTFKGML